MGNKILKNCTKCNQQLRIPTDIGGMVMMCPSCGHKIHSDFKLSHGNTRPTISTTTEINTDNQSSKVASGGRLQIVV